MTKVFLGGTCNNSTWRDDLSLLLNTARQTKVVDLFNPIVDDWNEQAQKNEEEYKRDADIQLFVITPLMTGVFSIAEAVDCSNKYPNRCAFCVLKEDAGSKFTDSQIKSLNQVSKMIADNHGHIFDSLQGVADFIIAESVRDNSIFYYQNICTR